MPEQDNSVCVGATSEAEECTRFEEVNRLLRLGFNLAPPFAGRGRREAPGEGLLPRVQLSLSLRNHPSPRPAPREERGEGEETGDFS